MFLYYLMYLSKSKCNTLCYDQVRKFANVYEIHEVYYDKVILKDVFKRKGIGYEKDVKVTGVTDL